jgi:hypothetical protein
MVKGVQHFRPQTAARFARNAAKTGPVELRVVGLLFGSFFVAVVCAYGCTEYLLVRLDVRRRVLVGGVHTVLIIVAANLLSFAILWVSSLVFIVASGAEHYLHATIVCACAQTVWLGQHLWSYYRDHPRLRYEQ